MPSRAVRAPAVRKLFVLDTSVLIHDPGALHSFHEHDVVLPYVVLHEVDGLRKAPNGRGAAANAVFRDLETLRASHPSLTDVPLGPASGHLSIYMPQGLEFPSVEDIPKSLRDDMIIRCAQQLAREHPAVVVISKDLGLRLKASVHGLQAEDYLRGKVTDWEHRYTGLHAEVLTIEEGLGEVLHEGGAPAPDVLLENEFCYVTLRGHEQMGRFLCRRKLGKLHCVPEKWRAVQGIKPPRRLPAHGAGRADGRRREVRGPARRGRRREDAARAGRRPRTPRKPGTREHPGDQADRPRRPPRHRLPQG